MVSEFSRNILSTFQVRKKRRDKDAFIELLRTKFPELKVEENKFPVHTKNIVIGDLESAKVVLTAHYDTCAKMLVPNFLAPKNKAITMLYQIGLGMILGLGIGAIIGFLLEATLYRFLGRNFITKILGFAIIMYAFLWIIVLGPANKHTANDNTSGVITLITLLENMSEEERKKCCFVFFDLEEAGLWGSRAYNKMHKEVMKDKLLINFDCVSDGEYCMLAGKEKALGKYEAAFKESFTEEDGITPLIYSLKKVMYPSDQNKFPEGTAVAFFKKNKYVGYYMNRIHTKKDVIFEERNIEYLEKCVKRFVANL